MTAQLALQLAIVIAGGWLAAVLSRRLGQATAVGQMLMGLALGPSLLGLVAPEIFAFAFGAGTEALGWLARAALLVLMFQIGLAFDLSHLSLGSNRRLILRVAAAALLGPFVVGFAFGLATAPILSPGIDATACALFVATAYSITALPVLGSILVELRLNRTDLGAIAITIAAFIDLVGWILLGGVTGLVSAGGWVAPPLGVFLILAGFAGGLALHRRRNFVEAWNARVGPIVAFACLPLYFTYTGLRTDVGSLTNLPAWAWCGAVLAVGLLGKYGTTYVVARMSGLPAAQAGALGAMMNTRGLVELVVLNVGLDLGVISREMFTMMVAMAVISTVMTTPLLRRLLPAARGPRMIAVSEE